MALLNPIPAISALTLNYMNAGLKTTVAVMGTGFVPGSVLLFDGQPVAAAKFVVKSATEIDYTDLPAAPSKPVVTVQNPMPDGKISGGRTLSINEAVAVTMTPTAPTVRGGTALRLYPSVHNAPDQRVAITVNGKVDGDATLGTITKDAAGATFYNVPWAIPAAAVKIVATSMLDPNASATSAVTLQNPTPLISAVTPGPVTIGAAAVLTVTGKGFLSTSKVIVGGQEFTPQFVSDTSLKATGVIPAVPGRELAVKVANPSPGPLTSVPFKVLEVVAKKCMLNGQATECMAYGDAARFLEMATWGPTPASIAHLQEIGRDNWLAEQFAKPATPWALATDLSEGPSRIQQEFFNRALGGDDQLRQRVAFALSEIFVVSAEKDTRYEAMRSYMKDLSDHAFDSYRNVLDLMTLNPAMGWFLDMVNNDKANPLKNTVANENYAREVVQLFSIGLTVLRLDGAPTTTPATATYDGTMVSELAKAFTGWTYPTIPGTLGHWKNAAYFEGPMEAYAEHHDATQKTILFAGQAPCVVNAGGTPAQDLKVALDCLAKHPNVAPFIAYRLIQRLVKSNPTPAYVQDVATAFNASGGSLQATVKAILTHSEAATPGSGKLREPVFYSTSLLRALDAMATLPVSGIYGQSEQMGQKVLYSPSVFNYFSPFYRIPGISVVAPEFQGVNAASGLGRLNFAYRAVNNQVSGNIRVDLAKFQDLAGNVDDLLEAINEALYHGTIPANLLSQLKTIAGEIALETSDKGTLTRNLLFFAAAAPQYQVQQ